MIRSRRTRIVATLGPSSSTAELVLSLALTGVDVFRLNFSHGSHEDHARSYANVRAAEAETGRPLGVLADLQGPKLRLGTFVEPIVSLAKGAKFRLDRDPAPGDQSRCCLSSRARLPCSTLIAVINASGSRMTASWIVRRKS